jgi:hypothetical protein
MRRLSSSLQGGGQQHDGTNTKQVSGHVTSPYFSGINFTDRYIRFPGTNVQYLKVEPREIQGFLR